MYKSVKEKLPTTEKNEKWPSVGDITTFSNSYEFNLIWNMNIAKGQTISREIN